ncbi:MAG: DUF4111 domain-containing protein [Clostridiales bacterium]|nr:DUF4111 domain-containing protein [Clostridiales bacterium]
MEKLLEKIRKVCQNILGTNLTGIYVHGSIAFGCFSWEKSDVDFIIVVKERLPESEKEALLTQLLAMEEECPPKGLEMSVVLETVCKPFIYPTPFELHFSNIYRQRIQEDLQGYCEQIQGTDEDLAAHFTVIRAVGIVLWGKPISEVFGEVPKENYMDSIRADVVYAAEHLEENPVYLILNQCRVLAFVREGLVLSKKQGGQWAIGKLPGRWKPLVEEALASYCGNHDFQQEISVVRAFSDEMQKIISLDVKRKIRFKLSK